MMQWNRIGVVLVVVVVSFAYSLSHLPEPGPRRITLPDRSPVEAIEAATEESAAAEPPDELGISFPAGVFLVSAPSDPDAAAADNRIRPRRPELGEDTPLPSGVTPVAETLPLGRVEPGLYATGFDTEGCRYELWRMMADRHPGVIGEEALSDGRLLVTIDGVEPDWFASAAECGRWVAWTPLAQPLTRADDGDYWTGDLAVGEWTVPPGCRWEKVVAFRGVQVLDVIDSGATGEPLIVDAETTGVRIRGCQLAMELGGRPA
ncbi:MAG: hypothetical protein ACK5PP_18410 [Acidimicrobiales bacterium]